MIALLEGRIVATHADHIVVYVHGVGYKVFVPMTVPRLLDETLLLHTSLVVREDSHTLYGFLTSTERDMFELLLTCSGVGPKVAMAILSTLSVDNLRNAVTSERAELLTVVPGIGKKTAQKILFELKDKLPRGLEAIPSSAFDDLNADVIDTLVALGYSIIEAQSAVQSLPLDAPRDIEERVKLALQYFA